MNIVEAFRWLDAELKRYTYKPGFTMELIRPPLVGRFDADHWEAPPFMVRFEMRVPDSRRTVPTGRMVRPVVLVTGIISGNEDVRFEREREHPMIPVGGTRTVPYDAIGEAFQFERWLLYEIDGFEHHETREWFRRDGELVDDPHAGLAAKLTTGERTA
jgi:hypothetical protein